MQRSEVVNIAKKYAEHLKKSGIPLESLYLFGSQAKGTMHKWSDIDIAVISSFFREKYDEGRFSLWRLRRDIDLRIEPHGFTPEDWADDANPMSYEIKKTGLRVA
jgi:predicted nucleotidyltransferase